MCGRMNVVDDPIVDWVNGYFGVTLSIETNKDLRPTQQVAVIASANSRFRAFQTQWGIKPEWAKRIIINAQSETVATKKTFKQAFLYNRCLVPCMGWYEWRDEGGPRKQRYLFSASSGEPLLMAGIYFNASEVSQLVTLTTDANAVCRDIHKRMPVFVEPFAAEEWLESRNDAALARTMRPIESELVSVEPVS